MTKKKVNWIVRLTQIVLLFVHNEQSFATIVLFNLLSSWSWDQTLPLSRVAIRLLQYLHLNFFFNKTWKWTEETRPKCLWNRIWVCQISCDFFTFYKMWLCDSFSNLGNLIQYCTNFFRDDLPNLENCGNRAIYTFEIYWYIYTSLAMCL